MVNIQLEEKKLHAMILGDRRMRRNQETRTQESAAGEMAETACGRGKRMTGRLLVAGKQTQRDKMSKSSRISVAPTILILMLLLLMSGCARQISRWGDPYDNPVYIGTRWSLAFIGTEPMSAPWKAFWLFDLPFTLVLDTMMLPCDLATWYKNKPPRPNWKKLGYTPITQNGFDSGPPEPGDVIANFIDMKFVWIPPGEFDMGSRDRKDEMPIHHVKISKGFWMGQTQVTKAQYKAIMNREPRKIWHGRRSDDSPAVGISRDYAEYFCKRLSKKEHVTHRLPTEAEWEYACQAYNTKVNAWDLHDLPGSVWEWCSDWYGGDYYSKSPSVDPKGPSKSNVGVLRGGSSRPTARYGHEPNSATARSSFRVVVEDFRK
jgi:uncharacterized protein YceK